MQSAECGPRSAERSADHASRITHHVSRLTRRGFSLVEILVSIALLSFIILGLFAMFNQTQRAFMTSMGQTDVLEAARTVTDMMARELEQLTPSGGSATSFYTRIDTTRAPLLQNLPTSGTPILRTNYLQDIFMLTLQNQNWVGIGYCVRVSDPTGKLYPAQIDSTHAGVGSLYRFSETIPVISPAVRGVSPLGYVYPAPGLPTDPTYLWIHFTNACYDATFGGARSLNISNRICDGVVNLQLRAFATNGFPLYAFGTNAWFLARTNYANGTVSPYYGFGLVRSACTHPDTSDSFRCPDQYDLLYTWSNAVPACLELQLGVLEPRTFTKYDSIPATAKLNYIQRDDISTRVHLFRQRIPVRNVDPAAFQ